MSYEVISDIRKNTICFSSANYFTGYKVDDQNSSLDERREITFRYLVCTYFASHPEFYPVSNEESFPEDEELEPEADCPHTSSADTEMSGTRTPLLNAYIRAFFINLQGLCLNLSVETFVQFPLISMDFLFIHYKQ